VRAFITLTPKFAGCSDPGGVALLMLGIKNEDHVCSPGKDQTGSEDFQVSQFHG